MTLCATCARMGRDCCHARNVIPAGWTLADERRIVAAGASHAVVRYPVRRWEYRQAARDLPGSERALAGHVRLGPRLVGPERACVLLGPNGCRLAFDYRPRACQLFPLVMVRGEVRGCNGCMAVEAGGTAEDVLARLGMTAGRWHALLLLAGQEMDAHAREMS